MSTKPGTVPLFDTGVTNVSAPVAGLISGGYATNDTPTSGNINYLFYWLGQWAQYLSDGDLDVSPIYVTDAVAIANATTNDWNPGSGSLAGITLISMTGGGSSAVITGLQGGTLLDGKLIILRNDTSNAVNLSVQDSGSAATHRFVIGEAVAGTLVRIPVSGAIAFVYSAGIINKWKSVGSSWAIDMTPRNYVVGTLLSTDNPAGAPGATHTRGPGEWLVAASANPIYYPITLPSGSTLNGVSIDFQKNTNNTNTVALDVVYSDTSDHASGSGVTNSSNAPGAIVFSWSGTISMVAGRQYYAKFTPGGGITPAADRIFDVTVSYTPVA